MQTLKSFLNQMTIVWQDSTPAARMGIAILAAIFVVGIGLIGVWSSQPNYVVLANNLTTSQTAQVVDALDAANIGYEIRGAGSSVAVDKKNWSTAKTKIGLIVGDEADVGLSEGSPFDDPSTQENRRKLQLQVSLKKAIMKYDNVATADVLLSIPKRSIYVSRRGLDPSASVVIGVAPGKRFTDENASTIAETIARAVAGMTPQNVIVSDKEGRKYSVDESTGSINKHQEELQMKERSKVAKASEILTPLVGMENYRVQITIESNFQQGTVTKREIDPESQTAIREMIEETKSGRPSGVAGGVPGTPSNLSENLTSPNSTSPALTESEKQESDYVHGFEETTKTLQPEVVAQTVSIMINKKSIPSDTAPKEFLATIEASVSQAVGLQVDRDSISVEALDFIEDTTEEIPASTPIPWDQINEIIKNASLGLAALVAGFIAMRAFKKFTLEPIKEQEPVQADSQIDELRELVNQYPEVLQQVIASWSSNETEDLDTETRTPSRAA